MKKNIKIVVSDLIAKNYINIINKIDNKLEFLQAINGTTLNIFRNFACMFLLEPTKLQKLSGQFKLYKT